ncbi:MAG: MBL fold metallo-hydrolase [Christensenellaceae bacterium]|nr:MBL fold metallo-hydrolase [Christensenellaceae bacterium]
MKITYLDNSGFAVQMAHSLLIFDYYNMHSERAAEGLAGGIVDEQTLNAAERVYFFVSHKHYDHYNRGIFTLAAHNPATTFILPRGLQYVPTDLDTNKLGTGDVYDDGYLRVMAHPSTDIGVSYQVEVEGKTLFHAGDLNCWHWAFESTPVQEKSYRDMYTRALTRIAQHMGRPDVAFFPVDARMKGPYDDGAVEFIATFRPGLFVPMHMQRNYWVIDKLEQRVKGQNIFHISRRGDSLQL